jgi:hypothetical protein
LVEVRLVTLILHRASGDARMHTSRSVETHICTPAGQLRGSKQGGRVELPPSTTPRSRQLRWQVDDSSRQAAGNTHQAAGGRRCG